MSCDQCEHSEKRPVKRVISGGGKQYGYQCCQCGEFIGPRKIGSFPIDVVFAEFDRELRQKKRNIRKSEWLNLQAERDRQRASDDAFWRKCYNEYISHSPHWQMTRKLVMARDRRTCQACLVRPAVQVHHLKYPQNVTGLEDFEKQPLFEMISVCVECHEELHAK